MTATTLTVAALRAILATATDDALVTMTLRGYGQLALTGGEVTPQGVSLTTSTGRVDVMLGPPKDDPTRCRCGQRASFPGGDCAACDEVSRAACSAAEDVIEARASRPRRRRTTK